MKYSPEEIGFILYNNRSVNGTIKNFFDPKINPNKLLALEKKFDWVKSIYSHLDQMVEVNLSLLDSNADDEIITPNQISELTELFNSNIGKFSEKELKFLQNRKIPIDEINKWKFLGLSNFTEREHLRRIGATCHPILKTFLVDGIEEGGIVQPLFENGILVNCSIRRITDVGKLKYTLAVPDIPVWGLDDCYNEHVYICEGLFDMIALRQQGLKSVSPSSAMWSGIQLYKLLELNPKRITIVADNDRVGLKTGLIMSKFFNICRIPSNIVHFKESKDASEHFWEKCGKIDEMIEIKVTTDMIEMKNDNSFDFLKHLQNRKF